MNIIIDSNKDISINDKWEKTDIKNQCFEKIYYIIMNLPDLDKFKIVHENWEIHINRDYKITITCKNQNYINWFFSELFYSNKWSLLELNLDTKKED